MFNMTNVAKTIKSARNTKNMTQMDLADAMGVSFQAVSNWERGNSMPDISKLPDLCSILDLSYEELMGGEGKAGRIVIKVMEDREAEVTLEELAEIAPIVPPKTVEEMVKDKEEEGGKRDINAIAALAPFLDEEYLGELAKKAAVDDIGQVVPLAPFLSDEVLGELAKKATVDDISQIVPLAPFLDEEVIEELAKKAAVDDIEQVVPLAPFLDEKVIGELAQRAAVDDIGQVVPLAPFLGEKALDAIVTAYLEREDCSIKAMPGLCPFLSTKTVRKIADAAMKSGDYKAMSGIAPFIS